MEKIIRIWTFALACAALLSAQTTADQGKLLTTFQNPVGNLISVPFQNNTNFPIGEFSRVQDVLNIQPVLPIHVDEDWLLIHTLDYPRVVYQPDLGSACEASGELANDICEIRSETQRAMAERTDSAAAVSKDHAVLRSAYGLADPRLLQRDPPERSSLPEVAGPSAGSTAVSGREVKPMSRRSGRR